MWSLSDSQCSTDQLRHVDLPALVIDADGDTGIFSSDTAKIVAVLRERSGGGDVPTHTISGDHYLTQPEGARDEAADIITDWVRSHTA